WLDKLDSHHLRHLTKADNFNESELYDYEYKVFSLIFSGVFLEKVQEMTDRELSIRGVPFGWEAMDEEKNLMEANERREKHMEEINHLGKEQQKGPIDRFNQNEEVINAELNLRKEAVKTEWKVLFKRYWSKNQANYQEDDE